jgi:hypothetical protein
MPCASRASSNQAEFNAEINIHFPRHRESRQTERPAIPKDFGLLGLRLFDVHTSEAGLAILQRVLGREKPQVGRTKSAMLHCA